MDGPFNEVIVVISLINGYPEQRQVRHEYVKLQCYRWFQFLFSFISIPTKKKNKSKFQMSFNFIP